jgi:hypothetical protein
MNCPQCDQPLTVAYQPALMPGRDGYQLATCWTPDCPLNNTTLVLGEHARLTPEQVAEYGRANERLTTRTVTS